MEILPAWYLVAGLFNRIKTQTNQGILQEKQKQQKKPKEKAGYEPSPAGRKQVAV